MSVDRDKHTETPQPVREREPGIDLIRALACVFVVLLHTADSLFHEFSEAWLTAIAYDACARVCVPLFFMISGYFLLHGNGESVWAFYAKRLRRVLLPFFALLGLYCIKDCLLKQSMTFPEFLRRIACEPYPSYLWYIYTLVGIYMALPFFRILFETEKGKQCIRAYVYIWLIVNVFRSFLENLFAVSLPLFHNFNLDFFFGHMGYVLLGGLLRNRRFGNRASRLAFAVYVLCSALIVVATAALSRYRGAPQTAFLEYLNPVILCQSAAFFIALRNVRPRGGYIAQFAMLSYWIYLVHIPALILVYRVTGIQIEHHPLFAIPLAAGSALLLSVALAIPLRRLECLANRHLDRMVSGLAPKERRKSGR